MEKENESANAKRQKALKISIKEGSAASVSTSLGDSFITPFALAVTPDNIKNIVVGILSSFSLLFAQVSQFFGSRLMESYSRKKITLIFVFLQALMWLPIAALSFFVWAGYIGGWIPYLLIIFYSVLAIFGGLVYPSWFSWMGDLIPEKERGRYFSRRNLAIGVVGLSVALIGAFLLEEFKAQNLLLIGFSSIFIAAFLFRLISFSYLARQYSPPFRLEKKSYFSFWSFIKRYDNFGKFAVYQGFFNFAIMIASPFFAVYMLEELQFSYITYITVNISSTVFYLIFLPLIGKFSDRYGDLKLMYLANFAFVLSPLLWAFIASPVLLIFIPQIIVGLGNAALIIAVTNFTYASVSKQHRGICVAYTNILIGAGTFAGAIIGGIILNYLPISFMNKFIFVFLIAAFLRLAIALAFLPGIKEEKGKRMPHLHLHLTHPFKWLNTEIHVFNDVSRKKYSEGLKVWKPK